MKLRSHIGSSDFHPSSVASSAAINDIFSLGNEFYQKISQQLESLDLEKDVYLEGNQGKVYKISLDLNGTKKELIILKNRLGNLQESQKSISKEFGFHDKAYSLLHQHPNISSSIGIPKLYGYLKRSDGYSYIIMDFVPGKTIYTAKISAILPILYDALLIHFSQDQLRDALGAKEDFLCIENDLDAKHRMDALFGLPFLSQVAHKIENFHLSGGVEEYDSHLDFWHSIGIKNILQVKKQNNIFYLEELYAGIFDTLKRTHSLSLKTQEYVQKVAPLAEDFIKTMNEHDIYHNDFRSRNIILGDDDKIYIIDFGSAETQAQIYTQRVNIGDLLFVKRIQSLATSPVAI